VRHAASTRPIAHFPLHPLHSSAPNADQRRIDSLTDPQPVTIHQVEPELAGIVFPRSRYRIATATRPAVYPSRPHSAREHVPACGRSRCAAPQQEPRTSRPASRLDRLVRPPSMCTRLPGYRSFPGPDACAVVRRQHYRSAPSRWHSGHLGIRHGAEW